MLWHLREPIGVCVFAHPAASLSLRSRFFGLQNARSPLAMARLKDKLWLLQRVVLHPSYRGAGLASHFVRRACELCPTDWIETLSALGHAHPIFERAGFVRVGTLPTVRPGRRHRHGAFPRRSGVSPTTLRQSESTTPVYYLFDNRSRSSSY